jgi:NDP-sugar pyrophosphorylase family protein
MKPALLVLAAGMGSRYGSLKQIDRFGPAGETIVEYSIYDALRAGFEKIILVVRKEFVADFKEIVLRRALQKADIQFVFQELEHLPPGFVVPPGRVKPWGTAHAVLVAEELINTPFAVINADDFYGADSYHKMYDFLTEKPSDTIEAYGMVVYQLSNTLSESGSVSRGVCRIDSKGFLTGIEEHTKISREADQIFGLAEGAARVMLTGKEYVSMNLIGFRPTIFSHLKNQFIRFLKSEMNNNAEFFLPSVLNEIIQTGKAKIKAIKTVEQWFGVTYREDRETVSGNLGRLVRQGVYPPDLWQ